MWNQPKVQECDARVLRQEEVAPGVFHLVLSVPWQEDPCPGQFVEVQIPDRQLLLRRPISIFQYQDGILELLYRVVGDGTRILSRKLQAGDSLPVLGPLGQGYPAPEVPHSLCYLVGGGIGIPPLYYLGRKLVEAGHAVEAYLGFRSATDRFAVEAFQELGKTVVATEDGSAGVLGFVVQAIPDPPQCTSYYACGPKPLLRALEEGVLRDRPGSLSFEARMACGVGACAGCVLPTRMGLKRVCKDGPVFASGEVIYESM